MTQVLFIHGGMTYKSREDYLVALKAMTVDLVGYTSWSDKAYFSKELGEEFMFIRPTMPLKEDAKYEEWKIVFEQYFSLLDDRCVLIGNSLGGVFLAKYLSEHDVSSKVLSVYLVCAPFDNSLPDGDLVGGFELKDDLSLLEKYNVTFMFSQDDDVVPLAHMDKYKAKVPSAQYVVYEGKNGHFCVPEFPELVEMIKRDVE